MLTDHQRAHYINKTQLIMKNVMEITTSSVLSVVVQMFSKVLEILQVLHGSLWAWSYPVTK